MSGTLEAVAVLVGIPALVGMALPRRMRRVTGIVAAVAAVTLWAMGLNLHNGSALLTFISSGVALGALLREGLNLLVRVLKPSSYGAVAGRPSHG